MTVQRSFKELHEDFLDSIFDAVKNAGSGKRELFSTIYSQMLRIVESSPHGKIGWGASPWKKSSDSWGSKEWICYYGLAETFENLSERNERLSDEAIKRFDDLLFYFRAPNVESYDAIQHSENVRIKDLVSQAKGKNTINVNLNRLQLLERGHKATNLDIAGIVLSAGYSPSELEALINTAFVRGIPMNHIRSIHRVRRNCTVQQLIAAAENFDSTVELRDFAKGIPVSPKTKSFWDVLLNSKMGGIV